MALGIPLQTCSTSSLNFEEIFNEHTAVGPLINTKYKVKDNSAISTQEILLLEHKRDSFKSKLEESRTLLKCMLTPTSHDTIIELLDRTFKDIKSNIVKSNDTIFHNCLSTFNLDKLLGYRWRSFVKDISKGSKHISISNSFQEMLQTATTTKTVLDPLCSSNLHVKYSASSTASYSSSPSASKKSLHPTPHRKTPQSSLSSNSAPSSLPSHFLPKNSSTPLGVRKMFSMEPENQPQNHLKRKFTMDQSKSNEITSCSWDYI
ncbi:hypothetical protein Bhyg_08699 [Pseudolycoriella hygida]|uniref:Uncharacterized protein n=1 Tax=Pseudolycoriella hygida TaxID=35572 RepID=A0A9Q0N6W4_9DIPT|nr:hypothetical protein Bhyg_08699 [Pseudolycoriella hygida]